MRAPLLLLLPLLLCAAGDGDDQAQGTMTVTSADGGPARICRVTSLSLSNDRSHLAGEPPPAEATHLVALTTEGCIIRDADLLGWVAGRGPKRSVTVTFPPPISTPGGGGPAAMRYEMDGADAVSFNVGHSGYASQEAVQLSLEHLRINGVALY